MEDPKNFLDNLRKKQDPTFSENESDFDGQDNISEGPYYPDELDDYNEQLDSAYEPGPDEDDSYDEDQSTEDEDPEDQQDEEDDSDNENEDDGSDQPQSKEQGGGAIGALAQGKNKKLLVKLLPALGWIILIILGILLLIGLIVLLVLALNNSDPSLATNCQTRTITLDPGHPSDISEGVTGETALNWSMANKIKPLLETKGYRVVLTKSSETEVVTNKRRAEIANENNSALFFRIHANGSGDRGYFMMTPAKTDGTTGLPTQSSYSEGLKAAQAIITSLDGASLDFPKNPKPFWTDADAGNATNGLLDGSRYSQVPVTLIEMGNLNNTQDLAWLNIDTNRDRMAAAITAGIESYVPPTTDACSYGQRVVEVAKTQLGKPYCWGGMRVGVPNNKCTIGNETFEGADDPRGKGPCCWKNYPPPEGALNYDCSSFAAWAWYWGSDGKVSMHGQTDEDYIRHSADANGNQYQKIGKSELQVGDLVYFGTASNTTHVAIYEGNDMIIHAAGTGIGVIESKLSAHRRFVGGLHIIIK